MKGGADTPISDTENDQEEATGTESESEPGATTAIIQNCGHTAETEGQGRRPALTTRATEFLYVVACVNVRCVRARLLATSALNMGVRRQTEQLELATESMGLNAFQCGFPYLKLANIKGHLERGDCRTPDVCGQAPGSEPAGARLLAKPCTIEDCACQTKQQRF